MVDPRDYDRLRFLQMNAAHPNTFEETIHRVSLKPLCYSALVRTLPYVGPIKSRIVEMVRSV